MKEYTLTVFEKNGEKLMDETFSAENNEKAKVLGKQMLEEKGYMEKTHRCVSPDAKLVLFHP